jgi:acyl dehydratase
MKTAPRRVSTVHTSSKTNLYHGRGLSSVQNVNRMTDLLPGRPCSPVPRLYGDETALWYEDLHVGDSFVSRSYQVTQEEIVAFASRYDPQIFHLDAEAAKATFFGGLAASGWHTAAITMRLIAESVPLAWGIIGAGTDDLHWQRPTRVGDCLRVKSIVVDMRPLRSKPGVGMMTLRCATVDDRDEPVQTIVPKLFVPFRSRGSLLDE